ncbi:4'-phosphopantetheinyl transferase superfamily protein [Sphingomonas sanguinis]|uniref:Uncharacterized protein n=1 Tax=Sphingomonas sanguinis TaxID=33051 RepID=A0A147I9N2_9SPHN|nr:4'-phosphopantetheinyl transferase superfamily protein [Sphingomonas sanguinis]KTT76341.1 hypothetical protein NS319_00185 [Sphingomonas sanguinis]
MTPHWHDGPLDGLIWDGAPPVIWRVDDPGRGRREPLVTRLLHHLSAATVTLARSSEGKPEVLSPKDWHISLSGRAGLCLIAAARQPVAVDREVIDDSPPLWDMMTAHEAVEVRAVSGPLQVRQWLRRWTIKEAHAKLIGTPRRIAPEAIETRLIDPIRATAVHQGVSQCWTREQNGAIETVAFWAEAA